VIQKIALPKVRSGFPVIITSPVAFRQAMHVAGDSYFGFG
jgi:hypothetical protein